MSDMKGGGPAFPVRIPADGVSACTLLGMSLRDYFAAKALNGYWSQPDEVLPPDMTQAEHMARMCRYFYDWADAMLAERAK